MVIAIWRNGGRESPFRDRTIKMAPSRFAAGHRHAEAPRSAGSVGSHSFDSPRPVPTVRDGGAMPISDHVDLPKEQALFSSTHYDEPDTGDD